jgi:hypothetical protein
MVCGQAGVSRRGVPFFSWEGLMICLFGRAQFIGTYGQIVMFISVSTYFHHYWFPSAVALPKVETPRGDDPCL